MQSLRFRSFNWKHLCGLTIVTAIALSAWFSSDFCLWSAESSLARREQKAAGRWVALAKWSPNCDPARTCLIELRLARRAADFRSVDRKLIEAVQLGVPAAEIQRERWLALAQASQFKLMEDHWIDLLRDPREDEPEIAKSYYIWALLTQNLETVPTVLELWHQDYPNDAEPLIVSGQFRQHLNQGSKAEEEFQRALELAPDNDECRLLYAKSLLLNEKAKAAIPEYQKYLARHPDNIEARRDLATCFSSIGEQLQAIRLLEEILQSHPDDFDSQKQSGELLLASGNAAGAVEMLQSAHRSVPEDSAVSYELAQALTAMGKPAEATPYYALIEEARPHLDEKQKIQRQISDQPNNIELRLKFAEITAKYVSRREAMRWYMGILQKAPQCVAAQEALAVLTQQVGDQKQSAQSVATNVHKADAYVPLPAVSTLFGPNVKVEFKDITERAGVQWVCRNGEESRQFAIIEQLGSGCAVDDFDGDSKLDLYFAGGGQITSSQDILPLPIGLFRQAEHLSFTPVTAAAWLEPVSHYNHGISTADFDNDGFSDLLVTGWNGLQLFRNQGDGTFFDETPSSGLIDTMWSTAAGWGDFNQDQILDLYVGHYVDWSFSNNPPCYYDKQRTQRTSCEPRIFNGLPPRVYVSNGDGTYRDASLELGIHDVGATLGCVIADINEDDRPDIYVANDQLANQLYVSQPGGGYQEAAVLSGVAWSETAKADGSMGVDVGDINNDGKLDYWVTNFEKETFALYRNLGHGTFTHASRAFGINSLGTSAVGFGTVLMDIDGDGFEDIFCSNGHVLPMVNDFSSLQLPYLLWNDHGQRFQNIAKSIGGYFQRNHLGRGAASGDLDANGSPDLVVTHTNEPAAVLLNETPIQNWLSVRLIGRASPRSAIGARVTIHIGQQQQIRLVKGGGSYLSTSDRTMLFGLGDSKQVDSLEVRWPTGHTTHLTNIAAGTRLQIVED